MKKNNIISLVLLFLCVCSCSSEYNELMPLSDVSWYHSKRTDPLNVSRGDFMSFIDVSQGELNHVWTIQQGDYFLDGPLDANDSLELFINEEKGLSTDDKSILVYFDSPGLRKITLRNTFTDSVAYRGEVPLPAVKEGGVWLIDTTFVVDVFDEMKPAYKVFQLIEDETGKVIEEKEILSISEDELPDVTDVENWKSVDVEVGGRLKFIDLTTTDRPTGRTWTINNKPGSSVTSTEDTTEVYFSVYGFSTNKLGSLTSKRNGEDIPASSVAKVIPLKVNVVSSSKPFRYIGGATKTGRNKVLLNLSGEAAKMTNAEAAFRLHVSNASHGLETDIVISSVKPIADDKTMLELTLASPVYEDDVLTLSFDNTVGTVQSFDERDLEKITEVSVINQLDGAPMFSNDKFFGFEEFAEVAANCPGYWHPKTGPWWRSEDKAFESTASMKYSWDITNDLGNGNVLWGWNVDESVSGIPQGTYMLSCNVYIEDGSDIKTLDVVVGNGSISWGNIMTVALDLSGLARGQWHTIRQAVEFTSGAAVGDEIRWGWHVYPSKNSGVTGVQTFYLDNYQLTPFDVR